MIDSVEPKDITTVETVILEPKTIEVEPATSTIELPIALITVETNLNLIEEFNFDYSGIDTADEIKAATSRIKARWKRVGEDLIGIGKELNTVKDRIPHGQFLPWLRAEFELSERTANDLMNVATRFEGKSANIADLNSTVLYLLAAPSTPDEVVDLAIETAAKGETVSVAKVKEWKQEASNKDDVATLIKKHNIPTEYHADLFEAAKGWANDSAAANREGTSVAVKGFAWWDRVSGSLEKRMDKIGKEAKEKKLNAKFGSNPFETTVFGFVENLRSVNSGSLADLIRCSEHFDTLNPEKLERLKKILFRIQQDHNAAMDDLQSKIDYLLLPIEIDVTPAKQDLIGNC